MRMFARAPHTRTHRYNIKHLCRTYYFPLKLSSHGISQCSTKCNDNINNNSSFIVHHYIFVDSRVYEVLSSCACSSHKRQLLLLLLDIVHEKSEKEKSKFPMHLPNLLINVRCLYFFYFFFFVIHTFFM